MKKISLFTGIILLFLVSISLAEVKYIPKADNFIFLVDHSGSMSKKNNENKVKIALAKKTLTYINENLPPLEANFGLYTFAPFKEYQTPSKYDQQVMQTKINQIQENLPIFGRFTPIGDGLDKLEQSVLKKSAGTTRVIVITDGGQNTGKEPLPVLEKIYTDYNDKVCFHFISVDKSNSKVETLQKLASLNPCSSFIFASDLEDKEKLNSYLEKVFYSKEENKPIKKEVVKPEPKKQPEPKKEKVEVEEVIVFRSINFDFDSAKIKPEAKNILEEAALILNRYPERKIIIEGHTCNLGPAKYNQKLSERRAQSVANFLVKQGVDKARITTIGYGEEKPKFDNKTLQGRKLNRRVEIRLK